MGFRDKYSTSDVKKTIVSNEAYLQAEMIEELIAEIRHLIRRLNG